MYGYIYKTTDLITNKIYIGKKCSIKFLGISYVGSGIIIQRIVAKCKQDNVDIASRFSVVCIDIADDVEQLNLKEKLQEFLSKGYVLGKKPRK